MLTPRCLCFGMVPDVSRCCCHIKRGQQPAKWCPGKAERQTDRDGQTEGEGREREITGGGWNREIEGTGGGGGGGQRLREGKTFE